MSRNRKRLWLAVKSVLAVAILVGVGRQFAKVLSNPELAARPFAFRPQYLVPAAALYLLAHCCWGSFWVRLLRSQGVRVSLPVGLRAYFVSQFGKYVPGKAWVIFIRVGMLRSAGGKPLPVAVTATYETLTSMAAGAMLGVLFLPWLGVMPAEVSGNVVLFLGFAALPLVLAVLNAAAARVAKAKRGPDAPPLPSPSLFLLAQGLLQAAVGWCLLAVSLGLTIRAVAPDPPAWSAAEFPGDLAAVALSYVSGFVILVAPGGVGVREFVLQAALGPRFAAAMEPPVAAGLAVVVALVLRLAWSGTELVLALGLYLWQPATDPDPSPTRGGGQESSPPSLAGKGDGGLGRSGEERV